MATKENAKERHPRSRSSIIGFYLRPTLGKERAVYGQQIVVSQARQLVQKYGPSFGEKSLRRMMPFAEVFPQEEIVVLLIRQ
jgi:hypothetical protein